MITIDLRVEKRQFNSHYNQVIPQQSHAADLQQWLRL